MRLLFLKLKSKEHAKLFDQVVFQVTVFDFIFSHKNTLDKVDQTSLRKKNLVAGKKFLR